MKQDMKQVKKSTVIFFALLLLPALSPSAQAEVFTLKETIGRAVEANLELKASEAGIDAARANQKSVRTEFYPSFDAQYRYQKIEEDAARTLTLPEDQYTFVGSISQPIFTGFSTLNQYRIAQLGLDAAALSAGITRQDVIFAAKDAYFSILKAQKLVNVANQAVAQLESHKDVAENFYKVGMTPLNDFLKSEVELANARQDLITAQNNLDIAESDFNLLLRRPINAPVQLEEVLYFISFEKSIQYCLTVAMEHRLNLKLARADMEMSQKEVELAKSGYYPKVNLEGNYYRRGEEWDLNGGPDIPEKDNWEVQAVASWRFWEWGKTGYDVKAEKSRLAQVRFRLADTEDRVALDVKQSYLNTKESEQNIVTVQQALEQARENFRISEQRYKEQIATSTDVLDAQTLLTRTMSNYYNALYNFKISKAALFRAMGVEVFE